MSQSGLVCERMYGITHNAPELGALRGTFWGEHKRDSLKMTTSKAVPRVIANSTIAAERIGAATVYNGDSLRLYERWERPTCIIVDGPYGLGKFPGEPNSVTELPAWYAPHIAAWAKYATTDATLWFWGSELSWASVHSIFDIHGWQYEEACIWDKGLAHVAGNVNSKTIRGVPVVSEIAVRYTRRNRLADINGNMLTLKEWVRAEWLRSGLPLSKSNDACGVKNAATRKYLTQCHLWYFPPAEAMEKMADYCARYGQETTRPYFSLDGRSPFNMANWERMRAKWNHVHGVTNIWQLPPVHGSERLKSTDGYIHANQKPLQLMKRQVLASTDIEDVVWEPFGGLFSATLAAVSLGRRPFAAEMNAEFYRAGTERLKAEFSQGNQRVA